MMEQNLDWKIIQYKKQAVSSYRYEIIKRMPINPSIKKTYENFTRFIHGIKITE